MSVITSGMIAIEGVGKKDNLASFGSIAVPKTAIQSTVERTTARGQKAMHRLRTVHCLYILYSLLTLFTVYSCEQLQGG